MYEIKLNFLLTWGSNDLVDGIKHPLKQGVSQDLERECPNLLEISKQGVQIVHLQYFYM